MRFMLLICHDSSFTARTVKGDSAAWLGEMERGGVHKHGDRLRPATEAKTVSMRDGELVVHDGPIAETKDEVADYDPTFPFSTHFLNLRIVAIINIYAG